MGTIVTRATTSVGPTSKAVDGSPSDWTGTITRLAGTAIYSHGEYVYQDYIGDSWGADDGSDAQRLQTLDTLKGIEPRTYRLDPFQQAAGDQFGAQRPIGADIHYGDTTATDAQRNAADIEEVRVAADAENLYFLVRTTGMTATVHPAVLMLLDTEQGGSYPAPGGLRTGAEWAFLTNGQDMIAATYKGGPLPAPPLGPSPYRIAVDPSGYVNTMEIGIARSRFEALGGTLPARFSVGIATGAIDPKDPSRLANVAPAGAASDLLNVAFRHEPARIWMDEDQALALLKGNIDQFLAPIDIGKLTSGYTETFEQRPGYYNRIYVDETTPVNTETMTNEYFQGAFQHYGLYLPQNYSPDAVLPATFWMHYRGGHANDAAAWEPGILRQFGDERGGIVVTPSARGTSSWYTGRGMVDFQDVWQDVTDHYGIGADGHAGGIDPNRVLLAGHSMGGWASYLFGVLYPDRWAASNPEDGLLVPGLWLGTGSPSDPQDGADLNAEFLYPLLGNVRNVPYAILHGTEDELVPVTSAIASGLQLHELGYRYRLYLFHTYEHYSAPIWDDWRDVVKYMSGFTTNPNPARVTYSISPALYHAISTISVPTGVDLHFTIDRAYWVSDLHTRAPGIDPSNIGTIDATTFGRGVQNVLGIPEVGAAQQPEVYTMTGQRWLPNGSTPPENRFTATLTDLASATFALARMGLSTTAPLTATIKTDGQTTVLLSGVWSTAPSVNVAGGSGTVAFDPHGETITFPRAGTYTLTISP